MHEHKVKKAVSLEQLRLAEQALHRVFPTIRVPRNAVLFAGTGDQVAARTTIANAARSGAMFPTAGPTVLRRGASTGDHGWVNKYVNNRMQMAAISQPAVPLVDAAENTLAKRRRISTQLYREGKQAALEQYTRPRSAAGPTLTDGPKTPAGKEAYNRAGSLHEYSERSEIAKQERLRYSERAQRQQQLMSHASTLPALSDLNIAATLKGPGAEAADALRLTRLPEVSELYGKMPELSRLDLGHQRLSRHAIRRIDAANARINAYTAKTRFSPATVARAPSESFLPPYSVEKVAAGFPGLKVLGGIADGIATLGRAAFRASKGVAQAAENVGLHAAVRAPNAVHGLHSTLESMAESIGEGSSPSMAALSALGEHVGPWALAKAKPGVEAAAHALSPYRKLNELAARRTPLVFRRPPGAPNPLSPKFAPYLPALRDVGRLTPVPH